VIALCAVVMLRNGVGSSCTMIMFKFMLVTANLVGP
jgi:hypothetical protein